ncbi:GlcG/HbpS family heme-binding protein [Actinocorallia populi]|uniref:GlcG/HbpS family heme-binding protein n=1 Tax=Actinocorallia populi TaxID=2079200 RepID=UPI000D091EF6|nr:heme-binding protein [Actinocorallia populi]
MTVKLTLAEAEDIIDAALRSGRSVGKAFSIAVVDAGGFLLSVKRVDGARPLTPNIAISKAYTSAVMERPSNMLKGWANSNPGFFAQLSTMGSQPIVATDGGVTIKRGGEILGGLGVSGGTPEEDQKACEEALGSLGYELEFPAWGVPGKQQEK